ncbi:hypothetical protein [Rhodoblastus sp.]|uniref:hypothetical protein n=1 Tax=Rhodoblastus sp. TaxID=1962975 RepID=UPI003F9A8C32
MSTLWLAAAAMPALLASFAAQAKPPPTPLLVMPLAFADGEVVLRGADHAGRVELLVTELRATIDRRGVYRTIAPEFSAEFLAGDSASVLQRARMLGATYVLGGALVNVAAESVDVWIGLFDAADGACLMDWRSTFSAQSDEAWRRAAAFIGDEVSASPPPR